MTENSNTPAEKTENGDQSVDPAEDSAKPAEPDLSGISELADALTEPAGTAGAPAAEKEEEPELDPLQQLAAENEALQDRLLRTAADLENLRRRAAREKAEATLYAASNFARDMLSVSDNMDRALDAASEEQRQVVDEITRNLLDGVDMVRRELLNIFEKHGIRRIEPIGERFDPNLHQAMFEIPDAETLSGTVLQVIQPGFVIGERVLRPAMVGVAKGGPKPEPAADPADSPPAEQASEQSEIATDSGSTPRK